MNGYEEKKAITETIAKGVYTLVSMNVDADGIDYIKMIDMIESNMEDFSLVYIAVLQLAAYVFDKNKFNANEVTAFVRALEISAKADNLTAIVGKMSNSDETVRYEYLAHKYANLAANVRRWAKEANLKI